MLEVVVDTNVIVSALLRPQSNPALTISLIHNRDCRLCLSDEIFTEYDNIIL